MRIRIVAVASSCLLCFCNGRRINAHQPTEKLVGDSSHADLHPLQRFASLLAPVLAAKEPTAAFSAPPFFGSIAPTGGSSVSLKQRAAAPNLKVPFSNPLEFVDWLMDDWTRGADTLFPEDAKRQRPRIQPGSPMDVYKPDFTAKQATMPTDNEQMISQAVEGTMNALNKQYIPAMAVAFPYRAGVEPGLNPDWAQLTREANRDFTMSLIEKVGSSRETVVVAFARVGIEGANSLQQARRVVTDWKPGGVIIAVAPPEKQNIDDLQEFAKEVRGKLVVCNGKEVDGRLPHSYLYEKINWSGLQLGGCVRVYPGPYEVYDTRSPNEKVPYTVEMIPTSDGTRALPNVLPLPEVLLSQRSEGKASS